MRLSEEVRMCGHEALAREVARLEVERASWQRQAEHYQRHCTGAPSRLSEMLRTASEEGYSSNEWVDYWIPAAIDLENRVAELEERLEGVSKALQHWDMHQGIWDAQQILKGSSADTKEVANEVE